MMWLCSYVYGYAMMFQFHLLVDHAVVMHRCAFFSNYVTYTMVVFPVNWCLKRANALFGRWCPALCRLHIIVRWSSHAFWFMHWLMTVYHAPYGLALRRRFLVSLYIYYSLVAPALYRDLRWPRRWRLLRWRRSLFCLVVLIGYTCAESQLTHLIQHVLVSAQRSRQNGDCNYAYCALLWATDLRFLPLTRTGDPSYVISANLCDLRLIIITRIFMWMWGRCVNSFIY